MECHADERCAPYWSATRAVTRRGAYPTLCWGLVASWAKDVKVESRMITARVGAITESCPPQGCLPASACAIDDTTFTSVTCDLRK